MDKLKHIVMGMLNRLYLYYLKRKGISVGRNVKINGRIFLSGTRNIIIDDDVYINSNEKSNPIGGNTKCYLKTFSKGSIVIGKRCRISNVAICSMINVIIEDDVYIGGDCRIYDTDFHSVVFRDRIKGNEDDGVVSKPIVIKRGAFIGASTIILKGVTVGAYSVVAAGTIVTKNIPDGELWGGAPAHFIKKINQ